MTGLVEKLHGDLTNISDLIETNSNKQMADTIRKTELSEHSGRKPTFSSFQNYFHCVLKFYTHGVKSVDIICMFCEVFEGLPRALKEIWYDFYNNMKDRKHNSIEKTESKSTVRLRLNNFIKITEILARFDTSAAAPD